MKHKFEATILDNGSSGGAYIIIPLDVEKVFGSKRPKIVATFDGEPYRGTAVRMGSPDHIVIIKKDIRAKIGKQPGDKVAVTLALDTTPRVVEVPNDFKAILEKHSKAKENFDSYSYTHQKEYVKWIDSAKKEETRTRRMEKAVEMLKKGKKK